MTSTSPACARPNASRNTSTLPVTLPGLAGARREPDIGLEPRATWEPAGPSHAGDQHRGTDLGEPGQGSGELAWIHLQVVLLAGRGVEGKLGVASPALYPASPPGYPVVVSSPVAAARAAAGLSGQLTAGSGPSSAAATSTPRTPLAVTAPGIWTAHRFLVAVAGPDPLVRTSRRGMSAGGLGPGVEPTARLPAVRSPSWPARCSSTGRPPTTASAATPSSATAPQWSMKESTTPTPNCLMFTKTTPPEFTSTGVVYGVADPGCDWLAWLRATSKRLRPGRAGHHRSSVGIADVHQQPVVLGMCSRGFLHRLHGVPDGEPTRSLARPPALAAEPRAHTEGLPKGSRGSSRPVCAGAS